VAKTQDVNFHAGIGLLKVASLGCIKFKKQQESA